MADPAPSIAALAALVQKFIADARAKAANGLTVTEFGSLVVGVLQLAVAGLEAVPSDGAAKRDWALQAVALLFDSVADSCVPLVAKPIWWIVRPAVRSLVLAAASGALEQVLGLVRAANPPALPAATLEVKS